MMTFDEEICAGLFFEFIFTTLLLLVVLASIFAAASSFPAAVLKACLLPRIFELPSLPLPKLPLEGLYNRLWRELGA